MIKGGARSGPGELAFHLLRADTNETVRLREFDGVAADTVRGALLEMAAIGAGARSRRPLYHASINTARDELMTDEQKARAIARLADELGLTGQPRVVVEHIKTGREHLHVVWSRIDGKTLKAIPDSHNYRKHEEVARELEREFEHRHVQGAHVGREGVERPARTPEPYEFMQAARSGITPEEARAELKRLWDGADSGQSFAAGLKDAGWVLAKGDKRDVLVALDSAGETHAINKKLTGLAAKDVRARLADLDTEGLPGLDEARAATRSRERAEVAHDTRPDETASLSPAEPKQPLSFGYTARLPEGAALWGSIAPVHIVQERTQAPKAHEPVSPASEVAASLSEATQQSSEEVETPTPARKADPSRFAAIVAAARKRLTGLAERLEAAIERHRDSAKAVEVEQKTRPMDDPSFRASLARGFAKLWGQPSKAEKMLSQQEGKYRDIEPVKTARIESHRQDHLPLPEQDSDEARKRTELGKRLLRQATQTRRKTSHKEHDLN